MNIKYLYLLSFSSSSASWHLSLLITVFYHIEKYIIFHKKKLNTPYILYIIHQKFAGPWLSHLYVRVPHSFADLFPLFCSPIFLGRLATRFLSMAMGNYTNFTTVLLRSGTDVMMKVWGKVSIPKHWLGVQCRLRYRLFAGHWSSSTPDLPNQVDKSLFVCRAGTGLGPL